MCNCIFDSQIAYIIKNKDEDIDNSNRITIIDYLNNKKLQKKIKKNKKFLVCENKQDLIKYESITRKSHFKHKNNGYNEMTEWHHTWQIMFDETKREITIGNRRADVCIDNNVIEFQYSKISLELVDERNKNYTEHNKNICWIIECNTDIKINTQINNEYKIEFINNYWKYESFKNCLYIFLDNNNSIYKIEPNKIVNNFITVNIKKSKEEFINSLKYDIDIWTEYKNMDIGNIYINQRGAGCGKTYESIQLKNDDRFRNKDYFIYLTKMNSAVSVIHKEFTEQYERNALIIDLDEKQKIKDDKDYIGIKYGKKNNKIKINYTNNNNDITQQKQIIIATIDSFMFAIGNKNTKGNDFFKDLVNSIIIQQGYSNNIDNRTGKIQKGNFSTMTLNNKCLIIIDEAQDLESSYIEACEKIMNKTGIDLYIIGDKLQSILEKNNVFTHFINIYKDNHNMIYNTGINQVKRFHNIQFIDFVNKHIKFEKYNVEPIQKICESCNNHKNTEKPYEIFEIPEIYNDSINNNDDNYDKINTIIKHILKEMDKQIKDNNYLPEDFMFIFPLIKKNYLARMLEEKIQQFWLDKFKEDDYRNNILANNNYWKNKLDENIYYKFAHLHFSTEGKPINLDESKYATRMVSIHASKGDGRNVVFLLGISEFSLSIFNKDMYCEEKDNLIYESLLHVALTRQKRFIYIGLVNNNDEIYNRFRDCDIYKIDNYHVNNLKKINKNYKLEKIIDYILGNEIEFIKYNNIIINHKIKLDEIWEENKKDDTNNIDWGHHTLRNAVFKYNILCELLKDENINIWNRETKQKDIEFNPHQFIRKLNEISTKSVKFCKWKEYSKLLKDITDNNKASQYQKNTTIPILEFSNRSINSKHNKYKEFIENNLKNIQQKIINNFQPNIDRIPRLCPLESIIYYYSKQVIDNGIFYEEPSIMNLYDIIYYIDQTYNDTLKHSNKDNCICDTFFTNNNKIDTPEHNKICTSYTEHYYILRQIENMCNNFDIHVTNEYNFEHKKLYNEDQRIFLKTKSNDFSVRNKYELLGFNDKYIINFIVEPQFCKLNYNTILIRILLEQYLIKNSYYKHLLNKKNEQKKIIHCIFSLDNVEPYFYDEDDFYNELNDNIINNTLESYIKYENNKYYDILFDYYQNSVKETNNNYKTSFYKLYDKLTEDDKIKAQIPLHILHYMKKIEEQINDIDKDCKNDEEFNKEFENDRVTKKLLNKEKFVESISSYFNFQ